MNNPPEQLSIASASVGPGHSPQPPEKPRTIWHFGSLSLTANVMVLAILGLLLVAIIILLRGSMHTLTIQQGQNSLTREAQVIRDEMQVLEESQLELTRFLAFSVELARLTVAEDASGIEQFLLRNSVSNFFDRVECFAADGTAIARIERRGTTELDAAHRADLVGLGRLGIRHTRLVPDAENDQIVLVAIAPIENPDIPGVEDIIGFVLTEQVLDAAFLAGFATDEGNISLALLANGRKTAQYTPAPQGAAGDPTPAFPLSEADLLQSGGFAQARAGTAYIAAELIERDERSFALGYTPVTIGGTTQAVLAIVADQQTLLRFEEDFVNQLSLTFVVLGLVAVAAMFLFMRYAVIQPLQTVQQAAEQMAHDPNLQQQISVTSRDEIGRLGTAFNTMAQNLRELYTSLEARVTERTAEVRQALVDVEAARAEAEAANEQIRQMNVNLEERIAERASELARNQMLLQSIIDNLPVLLSVRDMRNCYTLVNGAAARSLGRDEPQIIGQRADDLLPADRAAQTQEQHQRVVATGQPLEVEAVLNGANEKRTYQSVVFPIYDNTGRITAIGEIASDITERKRMEMQQAALQQQVIDAQQAAIRELSTPLIPITDNAVVMPLIGTIDSQRAQQIMETLLAGVTAHRAQMAILDVTGVSVVDTQVANALIQAAQAVKLLGAQVMLTGIQPQIAQTLVHLGVDLRSLQTRGSLQAGITAVLRPSSRQ